jgi:hypothetical protein
MRNGVLWCFGIAAFAAFSMGSPSCEQPGDPLSGGCEEYADDGYDPTSEQRGARFLFWAVLLTTPVIFGVMDSRKYRSNPWKKPDEK